MKIIIATTMVLLFSITAKAQPPVEPHKPPTIEERLIKTNEILQKEIKFNTSQETAVKKIFSNFFIEADKLHRDNPPSAAARNPIMKTKMDKLLKERDEAIKKVLTQEQYKKYEAAARKLHPPKPAGQNGPPPLN